MKTLPDERKADVRIAGGRVLTQDGPADADLLLAGGRIASLAEPGEGPAAAHTVRADGLLVLPGLVDAHTHSYAQLCRHGLATDRLEPWLPGAVASGAGLTAEGAAVAATLSAVDALRHGATTTLDHATLGEGHAQALVDAYSAVGARVALAAQVQDVAFADSLHGVAPDVRADVAAADTRGAPTTESQILRCRELIEAAAGHDRITVLLGPSTPERCSGALLDAVAALAAEHGLGLHVHLLETPQQRAGGDSLGILADHGLLRAGLSVAHGVHLDAADLARLHEAGAAVVHNPLSNLSLGSGRLDLRAVLEAGVTVGLGCDSWTTGGPQDPLAQARLALHNTRPEEPAAAWLTPGDVWALAAAGGAAAIGLGGELGVLTPGAHADFLLVDPLAAGIIDGVDLPMQLVMGGLGHGLREAWVAGRPVLRDGLPLHVDLGAIAARAAELQSALAAATAEQQPLADRLAALLSSTVPQTTVA